VTVEAPLDRLPLFARVGAVIPTQPVIQHTGEMKDAPITLAVISGIEPSKTENILLFQDAGDGYGYKTNEWRNVRIKHMRGIITIERLGYPGKYQPIKFIEAIGFIGSPKEIRVDGQPVTDFVYDANSKMLKVKLPSDEVKEIVIVR
jgi:alpha-glucosidase